jgi:large subunit ribosomal protein L19
MGLKIKHDEIEFGVGDVVRVHQKIIEEGKKERVHVFEGMVMGIKNRGMGQSFMVRRIGVQKVGIEIIFPINSPLIKRVEVKRKGMRGVKRAKLYYTRGKSKKEIEKIYSRASKKKASKEED